MNNNNNIEYELKNTIRKIFPNLFGGDVKILNGILC